MAKFTVLITLLTYMSINCKIVENNEESNDNHIRFLVTSKITATQDNIDTLGAAAYYAILAGSAITNTGTTNVSGDVGVSPGSSITGVALTITNGELHAGDSSSQIAQNAVSNAFNKIYVMPGAVDLSGKDLSGLSLSAGLYKYNVTVECLLSTGMLTLDAKGDANAKWIFQIGSSFVAGINSQVNLINSASALNIYWLVGSLATLNERAIMKGNIIAAASITFGNFATLEGRALARSGAITLQSNTIEVKAGISTNASSNYTTSNSSYTNFKWIKCYSLIVNM